MALCFLGTPASQTDPYRALGFRQRSGFVINGLGFRSYE